MDDCFCATFDVDPYIFKLKRNKYTKFVTWNLCGLVILTIIEGKIPQFDAVSSYNINSIFNLDPITTLYSNNYTSIDIHNFEQNY